MPELPTKQDLRFHFGDGRGPVPAHRHKNPDGSLGGWVANTAYIAPTVFVGFYARVFGRARLHDRVRVLDRACVFGDAHAYDCVRIHGRAWVCGNVLAYGDAAFGDQRFYTLGTYRSKDDVPDDAHAIALFSALLRDRKNPAKEPDQLPLL